MTVSPTQRISGSRRGGRRLSILLGGIAVAVVFMMVAKPALWG